MPGLTDWRGAVGIVTGASSGIGAQLGRDLAARGVRVALLARRVDRLEALAGEIGRCGGDAVAIGCDVADRAEVEGAVARVLERHGRIDLLVNNAGYGRHVLFKDHDLADVERMMRTNYLGTVYGIRAVLPAMRARRRGWIVNIASVAGKLGQPDEVAYSATKFAVTGFSEGLSYELVPIGIHVMVVYPALVRTEMFTPEVLARMPARAHRTFIDPPEFSRAVLRALERGKRKRHLRPHFQSTDRLRAPARRSVCGCAGSAEAPPLQRLRDQQRHGRRLLRAPQPRRQAAQRRSALRLQRLSRALPLRDVRSLRTPGAGWDAGEGRPEALLLRRGHATGSRRDGADVHDRRRLRR
ncbi:MAG: SDR family oxidoreductase [Deltaproteobacteria bacterium]|nr:MAG: SDR family oxidoreductase [Deltaproteobacteria bacterium]